MHKEVPIVDMDWSSERFAHAFGQALEDFGFVSVVNHGIEAHIISNAYAVARRVFALPDEVKRKYEVPETGRQRGYTPLRTEHSAGYGRPNLNEYFHFGRQGISPANVYPVEVPEARSVFAGLFDDLDRLSLGLLSSLGVYLGHGPEHFPDMARGGSSLMRVLSYPKVDSADGEVGSAAHRDINLITLLVAATRPGLWIKPRRGEWMPVHNPPEAIVVNSGDMLELNTLWRMPSTTHKVVTDAGYDGARCSIPFFVHPRSDVPLVTAGQYLEHRLTENKVNK